MSKILVVAHREDEAPIALEKAVELAQLHKADIHVMGFCYENLDGLTTFSTDQLTDVQLQLVKKKQSWLQQELDKLATFNGEITWEVNWQKDIHKSVIKETETNDYEMVVTQRHRTESFFHIPTEGYLLREATVPVYIAHESQWKDKNTLLVSVDLKNQSNDGQQMMRQLFATARDLADRAGATLQCCFSVELPEVLIDLDLVNQDKYHQQVDDTFLPQLQEIASEYGIEKDGVHVKVGKPGKTIASIATKAKAKTVIIGSMARQGIKGKLIGNTAEKLGGYLHTDMLVVPVQ